MLRYRFLFEQMVRRELRQKYKGSALGVLWYLVNPLVLMGAYALMFSVLLRVANVPDYPLFLLAGLIVWVFFSQSLLAAAPSLVQNAPLVRKVRFPREAIPASVTTVQLATFLVMLALLLPVALVVRDVLDPALLLLVPIVAFLFCLALGFSLLAAVLNAHYRDVEPILGAALLPWFFLSPIFFGVDQVTSNATYRFVLEWLNPVAPYIVAVRDILYGGDAPSVAVLVYVVAAAAVALVVGRWVFRRMESELAVVV